jgi:outer membrane receptor protein involved in Fe transport
VFANLNYEFNENWSAEVGLRYFDQTMDKVYFVNKPFINAPGTWPDTVTPTGGNEDVVPKVSLTYTFDNDNLVYALYSEGWRAGGANRNRTPFTRFPVQYEPDLLKNFEIGTKTRWMDNRLQLNATVFFGQWENYQIEAVDPSFQPCPPGTIDPDEARCGQPFQVMVANVGDAEQTGVEFDLLAAPSEGFDLGLSVAWVDAKTSEDFAVSEVVPKGTPLPNVPEWKLSSFAQYTWPMNMAGGSDLYGRLQWTWQDDSRNQLEDYVAEERVSARGTFIQPSYSILDFKLGMATNNWTLEAFVSNLTDERAVLYNDDLYFDPFWGRRRITVNRPREYGVRFAYSWN